MKKYLLLISITALFFTSCKKYEVQYGTETAATTVDQGSVYEIAYSTEEGVFLLTAAMNRSKMLVSFANKFYPEAGRVALSPNRDKVAYVDPDNGVPIIVDTAGNVLAELTQYTNTKDLGWHNGDQTLYILSNNQVHFYGQALDLPSPLFVPPSGSNDYEVTTLDINEDLDVVYGAIYYTTSRSGNYRYWHPTYDVNYKSPMEVDISFTDSHTSNYASSSVAGDTRRYYHTLRFSEPQYYNGLSIVGAYSTKKQSGIEFQDQYQLERKGLRLNIEVNGELYKKALLASNQSSRFWNIDHPYRAPLYIDWAIEF